MPAISRRRIKKEKQTPGALVFGSHHFWKLGCCTWSLFLETSERIIRQWQRQVQECASGPCMMVFGCGEASPSEARLLPMKGKVNIQKHHTPHRNWTRPKFSLLLPDPGRQGAVAVVAVALYKLYTNKMILISDFRETFANKNVFSRARKKLSRRFPI